MSNSGRKINYMLRPAKNIERKMIRDAAACLVSEFGPDSYRYVGFGSKYFTDFIGFHKYLHIDDMVSIESDNSSKEVYDFNKPFQFIEMEYGHSNKVLPRIDMESKRLFAWLDYDGVLNKESMIDVDVLFGKAISGSLILFSYNSRPPSRQDLNSYGDNDRGRFLLYLTEVFGKEWVPHSIETRGLYNAKKYSRLMRSILDNRIQACLSGRNSTLSSDEKWYFDQKFYFDYSDGVQMSTFGGILYQGMDRCRVSQRGIDSFSFIRCTDQSCEIVVPNFTVREIKELLRNMPMESSEVSAFVKKEKVFKEKDVQLFSEFYKYYPQYLETEMA